jgi:hypothetical protein
MINVYNLKILIVGLTTVLALSNFHKSDFRKDVVHNLNFKSNLL